MVCLKSPKSPKSPKSTQTQIQNEKENIEFDLYSAVIRSIKINNHLMTLLLFRFYSKLFGHPCYQIFPMDTRNQDLIPKKFEGTLKLII